MITFTDVIWLILWGIVGRSVVDLLNWRVYGWKFWSAAIGWSALGAVIVATIK